MTEKQRFPVLRIAEQGHFFVGGGYGKTTSGRDVYSGQMYVQFQIPEDRTQPFPIVLVHGGGQTGANFTATPDGRRGWMDYFVAAGYATYVVDQVGRGRSGFFAEVYGEGTRKPIVDRVQHRFVDPTIRKAWPQAHLYTQGMDGGVIGEENFDQFMASQVEDMSDSKLQEDLNTDALIALLELIGRSVLLTHSQSGAIGWRVGDARPDLVEALVAVEPNGPPIGTVEFKGAPDFFDYGVRRAEVVNEDRVWGVTRGPLQYDPPISDPSELKTTQQEVADAPDLAVCYLQQDPPHRLPELGKVKIVIVTGEASYHTSYDHCTAKWLEQAGVANTHLKLGDIGIHGNGHMMMLEKNNLDVAGAINDWIEANVGS